MCGHCGANDIYIKANNKNIWPIGSKEVINCNCKSIFDPNTCHNFTNNFIFMWKEDLSWSPNDEIVCIKSQSGHFVDARV